MTIKARYKFYFQLDDEHFADEATKNQLYYTYSGAAPVQSVRAESRFARYNKKAIMLLRGTILNHTFWFSNQEEADELWHTVLIPQLKPTLERTVQLQHMYQNKTQKVGIPLEPFERLFLQLDPYVFSFRDTLDLDADLVVDAVQKIRKWLNDGTFAGSELVQIDIPFIDPNNPVKESKAKAELDDTDEASFQVVRKPEQGEATVSDTTVKLAPDVEQEEAFAKRESEKIDDPKNRESANIESESGLVSDPKPKSESIDCTIWGIHFGDSGFRLFDTTQETWTELPIDEESAEN
jgi:hypothetical protein